MNHIFNISGLPLSENKTETNPVAFSLLYINNPDGSMRWIWPAHLKNPLFLKFYNQNNVRSQVFALLIKAIFQLRLQHFFFKKKIVYKHESPLNHQTNIDKKEWAIFFGTPGIHNKVLFYSRTDGQGSFKKIAFSKEAKHLIHTEASTLTTLTAQNIQSFSFPFIKQSNENHLELSELSSNLKRGKTLGSLHLKALKELYRVSYFLCPLNELSTWHQLKIDLAYLKTKQDKRIPTGLLRKLETLVSQTDENKLIEIAMSHGDFTPWNMFEQDTHLHIYDWELSHPLRPIGFDAFHFIMQQGILVDRKNWINLKKEINEKLNEAAFDNAPNFNSRKREHYFQLYLLFNCIHYLKIYSQQKNWHTQINWLLSVWSDAISDCSSAWETQREVLLIDLFDFLHDKPYAAIKFPNQLPEKLSPFSDVDLCIEKNLQSKLIRFLKNHPLVQQIQSTPSTHMCNHQVFCIDGSMLSLDLIWKLKRKSMLMLNTKQLLANAYMNPFGVKCLDTIDNLRYIGLFYVLNKCDVPEKFKAYSDILKKSDHPLDQALLPFFIDNEGNNESHVLHLLTLKPENKGWTALLNKIEYALDTLRSFFRFNGYIITFSGVDGAGKSTVIEKVKFRIEKEQRKRVVIIRHRPSILPILSSIQKGKTKAEQDAAERLPRQGTNTSTLSSLLRFSYYYLDYFFGQFVVYFKYVSRGYVVLYDRYYYDFINDSKRSNIQLPSSFIRAGFNLLLRPQFNYFLYAKPEIILRRKKELDVKTIEELNIKYISLFQTLKHENTRSEFVSIENIELNHTIDRIFNTLSNKAA